MAKRLNYDDRRKLLDDQRGGLSDTKLKEKFGIKDNRTLNRQLKLAEQEQEVKTVKLSILKNALVEHLNEVGKLIGEWQSNISTPGIDRIYFGMPVLPTERNEEDSLFVSLKEHLPFPILWRAYASWKTKVRAYIEGCQKIMKEIGEMEKRSISSDILMLWGTESMTKSIAVSEPLGLIMGRYRQAVYDNRNLKSLLEEINIIENKIHKSLQEIQLRRDHIMYSCKLCPGQARLSR